MENIKAKTENFKYYVYEHYLDGELFYIGKGTNERALVFDGRNVHWKAKVNGRETEAEVKIIATFKYSDHAEMFKKAHIKRSIELGENLTNVTHNKHNELVNFKSSSSTLKRIRLKKLFINNNYQQKHTRIINHVNQLENIINDFDKDSKCKGIVYSETIESMNNIKEVLIKKGYNPLVIWSTSSIYNNMNNKQMKANNELINTGKIPEPYDFLIFNSHLFTRVDLQDENVNIAIINSITEEIQQYVKGFVGKDIDLLVYRTNNQDLKINDVLIPESYIDTPLTAEMKEMLCKELNLIGAKGKLVKWASLKKQLIGNGYNVKNTQIRINKKAIRVSIIRK